jgi:hypothetical protein
MNALIILNNGFNKQTDFGFEYAFWGYNKFFKICCDKPFIRGDIAKIVNIDSNEIDIELAHNAKVFDKLPILIFLKTRIPHRVNSKYFPIAEKTDDFEMLLNQQIIVGQNKFYIYSLLVYNNCTFSTRDVLHKHFDNFNIVINRGADNMNNNLNNAKLAK